MKTTRRLIQAGFLVLTIVGVFIVKGHAEGWCPLGGVEALYGYLTVGNLTCSLGVSNFYILGGVLLLALLVRRAFCGYACPVGTISEWLQAGARRLGLRAWRVPYRFDRALALLKYVVLALILYFTWRVGELVFRGYDPCYALISRHGEDITIWAYVISGAIILASLVLTVPFCRWLCPLAAVFTPFSRFGLARVRRQAQACIDCGACGRICPMAIPVDRLREVTAARCTSCLDCLQACPKRHEGALLWGPPRPLGQSWSPVLAVVAVLASIGGAVAATYAFPLPSFVWTRGTPPARTATVRLEVAGVRCRHSTELFTVQLERDDEYRIEGYLRVEAWPNPQVGAVRVTYDPQATNEAAIKRAITEPQFDHRRNTWQFSAYRIVGYDPLAED